MMENEIELPNKLSQLLKLAVQDCLKVEKDPQMKIAMDTWHSHIIGINGNVCEVCMAGAVMDQTLKISRDREMSPWEFGEDISKRLSSINFMRGGYLDSAAKRLGIKEPDESVNKTFFDIVYETFDMEKGRADWGSYEEAWEFLERNDL